MELLKKNRDMVFGEVKLTIMIEDPRDVERKRLLGIDDENAPTREDLAAALEEINEGKIPEDRLALQMLAEELTAWPNLETEAPKKQTPSKSLYARTTDTGVDLKVAAKRLKVDWDSAADIGEDDEGDDTEVPPAVGYGALYLVTAFPVIIGISVVLILFYNSLQ
nr:ycf3-interacting protein 1, chloroplastic [Ipomoea batatas]